MRKIIDGIIENNLVMIRSVIVIGMWNPGKCFVFTEVHSLVVIIIRQVVGGTAS